MHSARYTRESISVPVHSALPNFSLAPQACPDRGQGGPLAQALAVIGPPAAATRWRAGPTATTAAAAGAARAHAETQASQSACQQALPAVARYIQAT